MPTEQQAPSPSTIDFLPLKRIDHLELWVGNARQAAHFYRTALGFDVTAYAGPETGVRDRASYVLEQGRIRLVVTTPLSPEGEMAEHVRLHGDGVRGIALEVDDAAKAFEAVTSRGAQAIEAPREHRDEHGVLRTATVATYGDTVHTFVERQDYRGPFAPGYHARDLKGESVGLAAVDHIVGNVALGDMNRWVDFYARTMGFSQLIHFDDADISTEYSALMSKVMQDGTGKIKFPINEPAEGRKKSQIQEYLDFYRGPGVQHVALLTGDILQTVGELSRRGVQFLRVPRAYYENLPERVGEIRESVEAIAELGILVDRDEEGYLLQIFTHPVQDRPTLFFEIIQRRGSRGFGKGNFKALFEAIEREQALRGNL